MAQRYLTEEAGLYISTKVNEKAPIDSPELTGTPKAPTAAAGTNTTQIATTAFVKKAVDEAVSSIYHPLGKKDKAEDLPDPSNPGDIWTVGEETVVTKDGEGKNVVRGVAGAVGSYDDLLTLDPPAGNGDIYRVENGDDGTGTYGAAYDDNSFFIYDGANWSLLSGAMGYPANTDYEYTEEDGWMPLENGIDLSGLVTKEELDQANYIKHEELEPVPLSEVMAWFNPAVTYSEVTPDGTEDPSALGWYEKVGDEYILSTDTTVDGAKTYYTKD